MIDIGIMQGRLLPPFEGRFQAFPADGWRREFALARDVGLTCIEWIFEEPHEADNPLVTDAGLAAVGTAAGESGVAVRSVCADWFMTRPLVDASGEPIADHVAKLVWLVGRAARLGLTYIVLPFVDSSSLHAEPVRLAGCVAALRAALPAAEAAGVELHLETDLPPPVFAGLLGAIDHRLVRANYDIGNSAALGYPPREELGQIGRWLGSVHIKDRRRGGGTVPLGQGAADLPAAFAAIAATGFERWFILQVARGEPGDEPAWIRHCLACLQPLLPTSPDSRREA